MGLARGIFVVDTHVHAQRHAFKLQEREVDSQFSELGSVMSSTNTYSNADRLLYHMDKYGVDMCVIMPAFAMTNEIDKEIVKKHPDRFVSLVWDVETKRNAIEGKAPWTIKAALEELERELETGMYVGIGEGLPNGGNPHKTWNERFEEICQIMELCRKYKVVATYHSGFPSGYAGGKGDRKSVV